MTPRLVLLPGLDGTGELFRPLLAVWRGAAPVVGSYPRDRFLDYDACVAHAATFLPAGERSVLLGESFSGPIAIRLAAQFPERVAGLVLCASFARSPRGAPLSAMVSACATIALRAPGSKFFLQQLLLNGHRDAVLLDRVEDNRRLVRPEVLASRLRAVMRCDAREELRRTRQPLLYLQAARDRLVPQAAAADILHCRPDGRIARIAAPHFVLQTKPSEAAAHLESWQNGISCS